MEDELGVSVYNAPMSKELLIFRHAKSSWSHAGKSDYFRPLNKRGREAVKLMGQTLLERDCLPEAIHLSAAARTTETCQLFLEATQLSNTSLHATESLYLAGLDTLLKTIRGFDEQHQRVMLLGHNSGLEHLLLSLCPTAPRLPNGKLLTTANIAIVELEGTWLEWRSAKLLGLLRPGDV